MEHDGLIDKKAGFNIRKKGNQLYINGKEQGTAVRDKYLPYLDGNNIRIKGNSNNLSVHVED